MFYNLVLNDTKLVESPSIDYYGCNKMIFGPHLIGLYKYEVDWHRRTYRYSLVEANQNLIDLSVVLVS